MDEKSMEHLRLFTPNGKVKNLWGLAEKPQGSDGLFLVNTAMT